MLISAPLTVSVSTVTVPLIATVSSDSPSVSSTGVRVSVAVPLGSFAAMVRVGTVPVV